MTWASDFTAAIDRTLELENSDLSVDQVVDDFVRCHGSLDLGFEQAYRRYTGDTLDFAFDLGHQTAMNAIGERRNAAG